MTLTISYTARDIFGGYTTREDVRYYATADDVKKAFSALKKPEYNALVRIDTDDLVSYAYSYEQQEDRERGILTICVTTGRSCDMMTVAAAVARKNALRLVAEA